MDCAQEIFKKKQGKLHVKNHSKIWGGLEG